MKKIILFTILGLGIAIGSNAQDVKNKIRKEHVERSEKVIILKDNDQSQNVVLLQKYLPVHKVKNNEQCIRRVDVNRESKLVAPLKEKEIKNIDAIKKEEALRSNVILK